MKVNRSLFIMATVVLAMLTAACSNAEARQDGKKKAEKAATETKAPEVKAMEINAEQFNKLVYDMSKEDLEYLGTLPAIVDFTAKWCGPCQRIAPILDQLANEFQGQVVIYKVDIDKNPELAKAFKVSSIPAILYIPAEGEPSMTIGSRDKARFHSEIRNILSIGE